ncbi:hypothetical protein [Paraburkholderia unamae]|uniref:Uncharacterized protein n=1 Tax=Paraburkholderia unamae TaxID=219649 RepID=A0ABX5KBY2_9BURK|nr:hypothetical protein [Paraburkholderia unamae]PVX73548.1 hypothetical protein C7402_12140 [Paraburkholderia unamae]RAR56248.1 hypothetical protein C7401_120113 [Paraburkholderia unamae]CAG9246393.1 conserved membrane hypothetical protein [Paraburkholderia unamae]
MNLTDWLVILAIALAAIAFFCSRNGRKGSLTDRARHAHGTRLLVQATLALWAALLVLERCFAGSVSVPFGLGASPRVALAVALALAAVGGIWSFRASRLLKARRIFGAC